MPKLEISLPDELLQELDEAAQAQQRTRNELLQEAAERYLSEQQKLHRWEDPAVAHAIAVQDNLAKQDANRSWDVVEEIRHLRDSRR